MIKLKFVFAGYEHCVSCIVLNFEIACNITTIIKMYHIFNKVLLYYRIYAIYVNEGEVHSIQLLFQQFKRLRK